MFKQIQYGFRRLDVRSCHICLYCLARPVCMRTWTCSCQARIHASILPRFHTDAQTNSRMCSRIACPRRERNLESRVFVLRNIIAIHLLHYLWIVNIRIVGSQIVLALFVSRRVLLCRARSGHGGSLARCWFVFCLCIAFEVRQPAEFHVRSTMFAIIGQVLMWCFVSRCICG